MYQENYKNFLVGLILILLPISSSLCIDMYLPSYGSIAHSFHINEGAVDFSMSIYLLGLALGQLIYGPISDKFGRRAALVPGLIIFCAASLLCGLSQHYTIFLIARFLQAIGACSCIVLCRAIVADSYHPEKRTQMLAYISASNIFSPALAPLFGGFVAEFFSWRVIFVSIFIFGCIMLLGSYFLIKETLISPDHNALKFSRQLENFKRLVTNRLFVGYVLMLGLLYAIVFVWVTLSPSILMHHFHVPISNFGLYFLIPATGSCLGAIVTANFSSKFDAVKYVRHGLSVTLFAIVAICLLHNIAHSPMLLVALVALLFFGTGSTSPQLVSDAMGQFIDIGGFASGIIGFIQTVSGALMGVIAGLFYGYSMNAVGFLLLLPGVFCVFCYLTATYKSQASKIAVL